MSAQQMLGKAPRGFRDDFQRAHCGAHCLSIGSKAGKSNSVVNPWVASTLSMMSANRWAGFLECMNNVVQNIGPEQRLERTPIDDVTGTFEEFVDVQFHPRVLKDAHRPVLEIHKHIDVAFRARVATCHRTKHCRVRNPKPPQIRLVRADCVEDRLEIRSHIQPRVYQTSACIDTHT
jgi:hypothetical protein